MRARPATACDRHSPGSRLGIMSRMRADTRGPLIASCTLARAAGLRNLPVRGGVLECLEYVGDVPPVEAVVAVQAELVDQAGAPLRQRVPHGVDPQAAPGVERDPVKVKGAGAGGGQALLECRHVAPARGRRRVEATRGLAQGVAGPGP